MGLSTLATCGDVNRNVMCSPNPYGSGGAWEVYRVVTPAVDGWRRDDRLSRIVDWPTRKVVDSREDDEPLYGPTYLPRKFKIAVAVPPLQRRRRLAHDLGLIAVVEEGQAPASTWPSAADMGMTHGEPATFRTWAG